MRPSLQFSIRSILILTLVVAAYFAGWKSSEWKLRQEMHEAIKEAREQAEVARMKAHRARYAADIAVANTYWQRIPVRRAPSSTGPGDVRPGVDAAVLPEVKPVP